MKKIISFFLASFCFLGSVSAQNPTLVYGTNDVKVTGGPVGKVLVPTNFVGRTIANGPMTVALSNSAGIIVTGGNLNMSGLPIVNVATATSGTNAVNLTQLNSAVAGSTNGLGTMAYQNSNSVFIVGGSETNLTVVGTTNLLVNNISSINPGDALNITTTNGGSAAMTLSTSNLMTFAGMGSGANIQIFASVIDIGQSGPQKINMNGITNTYGNGLVLNCSSGARGATFNFTGFGWALYNGKVVTNNPTTFFNSNVTFKATTTIGPNGSSITNVITATASLDFPSINNGAEADLPIAVTGAKANDPVILGLASTHTNGFLPNAFVASNGWVTVREHNASGSTIDQDAQTYRVTVIEH